MTRSTFFTTAAIAVMAGTTMVSAADYLFPSAAIPGGKTKDQVKQYVSFIWDDNGYSGEKGTMYEYKTGDIPWPGSVVGGPYASDDQLKVQENGMGLAWAREVIGGKLKGGHMTFNMISGLFVETKGDFWYNRVSKYGSYNNGTVVEKGVTYPWIVSASNGREQRIVDSKGTETQKPFMVEAVKKLITAGHEIGNHTIDHIETNSPYPLKRPDGSALWPNNGEGFDDGSVQKDALGDAWTESGTDAVKKMGWKSKAGKVLSKAGWSGIIKLGEEDGVEQNIYKKTDLYGFRAPRLEINSSMFYALKENNYHYDCGVEEGLEANRDGSNFLWPYTTDNGIPNFYTQTSNGEKLFVDSLPAGLWEVPVNVMIVPDNIKSAVFTTYSSLMKAGGEDAGSLAEWDGKVTGFDFNLFVLFGMTKDQALATMKHTLDLHYNGNRAPMQVGCHTDYFTPMYDFATLSGDPVYKEALKYNTWTDRKAVWEEFTTYAAGKADVQFVSGKELITEIKKMVGSAPTNAKSLSSDAKWSFLVDDVLSEDNAKAETFKGAGFNGDITLKPVDDNGTPTNYDDDKYAYSSYMTNFAADQLTGLSHISLNYNSNVPLAVRIYVEGDNVKDADYAAGWEVILNNKGLNVQSGAIPLSAFSYGQYSQGTKTSIDQSKITGIEIAPLGENQKCTFKISDIKLFGADKYTTAISGIASNKTGAFKIGAINSNSMNLSVPASGTYGVDIFSATGRLVRSIDARAMSAGSNTVSLNTLPAGVYMVKISGEKTSFATKALVK